MRELVLEGLKLQLPPIVRTPLVSVDLSLQRIMPFPQKAREPAANAPVVIARGFVNDAANCITSKTSVPASAKSGNVLTEIPIRVAIAMAGVSKDLNKLKELRPIVEKSNDAKLKRALGDACLGLASDFAERNVSDSAVECLRMADALGSTEAQWNAVISGVVLSAQAKTKSGPEADALFRQAGEKYAQALQIKPDSHETLNNWGNALSEQAKAKTDMEADALSALNGAIAPTCEHLEHWRKSNSRATRSALDKDPDFNRVRNTPQFQNLRNSLP